MMDPFKHAVRQTFFGLVAQVRREQLFYICGSETLPPPLTRSEEAEMLLRNASGDLAARDTLIEHNLRLVVFIARKFENTGMGVEDLVSIGAIGLIKAVHSFNIEKNIRLATYAARCIENEILMVLRRANRLRMEVSLDEPLSTDWDGNDLRLSDILGTEDDLVSQSLEADVERQALYNSIRRLDRREKDIVGLRYGLHGASEHTQKEVADIMGMSQSYISRIEKRIIKQLQSDMRLMA